jgi:hypothetical protein
MHRFRASHAAARLLLAMGLVLSLSTPVTAGGASISVSVGVSSPTEVTTGYYVAYPVTVTNSGTNTLNTVSVTLYATSATGDEVWPMADRGFALVGATPATCPQSGTPSCFIGQMTSGSTANVTFYFIATGNPRTEFVKAAVSTSEGMKDNSDGSSANIDYWESRPLIQTNVAPVSDDFRSGHAIVDIGTIDEPTVSTGLGVTFGNPQGTAVRVPRNAEVTITEMKPGDVPPCPTGYSTCFGWGSVLDVGTDTGGDEYFDTGIVVTMVWDDSQLPNGMTAKKLRVVHYPDPTVTTELWTPEPVTSLCTYDSDTGLPDNMPCFLSPPSKVGDKDIQAVMLWAHNGIGRGW